MWSGPFEVVRMIQHGALKLRKNDKISKFLMNCQRVKHYFQNYEDQELEALTFSD